MSGRVGYIGRNQVLDARQGATSVSAVSGARPTDHLRVFFDANAAIAQRLTDRLGLESDKPMWARFSALARESIADLPSGSTVLDLGGGRRCVYASAVRDDQHVRLVAVDVSSDELALNTDVDETCVANVASGLPFPDASTDLVLSRALLEHVDGVPKAARNMARVLKPGGKALHLVPGRYSLFGIATRVLPFKPLLKLLHAVKPETKGIIEFDVYYDHCYPAALRKAFLDAGFTDVSIDVCWAQPGYFEPFLPAFLLTSLYEYVVRRLRITRLAAYMIVSATR